MKKYAAAAVLSWIVYRIVLAVWDPDLYPAELEGMNVLITGGSTGLGEQIAYVYAKAGANVFITARGQERLKKVLENCKRLGLPNARHGYVMGDMNKYEERRQVVQAALKFFEDRLDHLLLNHAWIPSKHLEWDGSEKSYERIQYSMETNFLAYAHIAGLSFPALVKSNGNIGVINSLSGRVQGPYVAEYNTPKFAADCYFSSLRGEMNLRSVNVSFTIAFLSVMENEAGAKFSEEYVRVKAGSPLVLYLLSHLVGKQEVAADRIVRAVTKRQWEVMYPYWPVIKTVFLLRHISQVLVQ